MSWWEWAAVALLGGTGAITRFVVDGAISRRARSGLPIGTFLVNASGAFVLGLLAGFAASGDALLLAGTATIGSYTTFSTWMLETHRLAEDAAIAQALLNVLLSVMAGIGAALLGRAIGGLL
jgi:CrcB protein